MSNDSLRIVFAGTADFSAKFLDALIKANYDIAAVFTQPDKPTGRGRKIVAGPVKQLALAHNIPLYQPDSLKDEEVITLFHHLNPDVIIFVAYGLIFPKEIISLPKFGCLNVHTSLLPRWRGAAPIQRAILEGDKETGVSIMHAVPELDKGPVLLQATCPIYDTDTTADLFDRLSEIGIRSLLRVLQELGEGKLSPEEQDEEKVTYAHKIEKSEAKIDWSQSARKLNRMIRAFNPWPVAFTEIGGTTVRIWQATPLTSYSSEKPGTIIRITKDGIDVATGDGILRLRTIQFAGGKVLSLSDVLNSKKAFFEEHKKFI